MRMHGLGPLGIGQPQRTAAAGAEVALAGVDAAAATVIADFRVVEAGVLAPVDLERGHAPGLIAFPLAPAVLRQVEQ
jgi:hypothetical protein